MDRATKAFSALDGRGQGRVNTSRGVAPSQSSKASNSQFFNLPK